MRIIKISPEDNYFEVVAGGMDDLWHLERLIERGDLVRGKSERKIKPKHEGERAIKVNIFIEIRVEGVEFHEFSKQLRISGIVVSGKPEEFVEPKAFHTIEVDAGTRVKVVKSSGLKNWQVERLEKARRATQRGRLVAVVLDDEVADFALIKEYGFEHRAKIASGKSGKAYAAEDAGGKYFSEVLKKLQELGADRAIFAGPGFTKNNLQEWLKGKDAKFQSYFEATNSVGITGINELIKSGAIEKAWAKSQLARETALVEKVFVEIGKGSGLAAYGHDEVHAAVDARAVQELVVGDRTMLSDRKRYEALMERAEQSGAAVHIINEGHDAGKRLKGIGGIAAVLRYKMR